MAAQPRVERLAVTSCVNHPVGAPQFAAVATLLGAPDAVSGPSSSSPPPPQPQHQLSTAPALSATTSLVTALPHQPGTFYGVLWDKAAAAPELAVRPVQCFAAWTAPDAYRNAVALATAAPGGRVDYDDFDGGSSQDDKSDGEGSADGNDDDDAGGGGGDGDGNGSGREGSVGSDGARAAAAANAKRKRRPAARGKKRKHFAFRRQAERLPEGWFVLSPVVADDGGGDGSASAVGSEPPRVTGYDMLPLVEVFSCQRKLQKDAKSQRTDGAVPQLFHVAGTRRRRGE